MARKRTYKVCPTCGKEFESLGYASHRAMHRRERERAKKMNQGNTKLSDYDTLECQHCGELVKPSKVNKDDSVSYRCKECGNTYKITADGELDEA